MMPSNWATHGRRSTRYSCERQGEAGLGLSLPLGIHSRPPSPWGSVTVQGITGSVTRSPTEPNSLIVDSSGAIRPPSCRTAPTLRRRPAAINYSPSRSALTRHALVCPYGLRSRQLPTGTGAFGEPAAVYAFAGPSPRVPADHDPPLPRPAELPSRPRSDVARSTRADDLWAALYVLSMLARSAAVASPWGISQLTASSPPPWS
jgi:hypothetical protein